MACAANSRRIGREIWLHSNISSPNRHATRGGKGSGRWIAGVTSESGRRCRRPAGDRYGGGEAGQPQVCGRLIRHRRWSGLRAGTENPVSSSLPLSPARCGLQNIWGRRLGALRPRCRRGARGGRGGSGTPVTSGAGRRPRGAEPRVPAGSASAVAAWPCQRAAARSVHTWDHGKMTLLPSITCNE